LLEHGETKEAKRFSAKAGPESAFLQGQYALGKMELTRGHETLRWRWRSGPQLSRQTSPLFTACLASSTCARKLCRPATDLDAYLNSIRTAGGLRAKELRAQTEKQLATDQDQRSRQE